MNKYFITFFMLFGSHSFILAQTKPNIILIVADDHGREALGCYGNKVIQTPHLDQLAREGTRFDNAFCTTASCSPSRAVMLTGMHNHANGMYGLEHNVHHFNAFDTVKSLPVLLANAGYATARIGKYHVGPEKAFHFQQVLSATKAINRSTIEMADSCLLFFQQHTEVPFFLYFAPDDPHRSGGNGSANDGYVGNQKNLFGNRPNAYPHEKPVMYDPAQVIVPPFLPDTKACREELAQYYQSISRLDQGVGKLIEHLKTSGLYDKTLIIYLSDNGCAFPGAKTTLYEPGMRLPCIVKLPQPARKNFVQNAIIAWTDITPTLLDFAGALPNAHWFQGKSFKDIIETDTVQGWDEMYASHTMHEVTMYYPMRVLREKRYKLIWNIAHGLSYPMALDLYYSYTWSDALANQRKYGKRTIEQYLHRPEFELYDLQNDPDEVNNLAASPTHQNRLQAMKKKIRQFQETTKDPWLIKWQFD